MTLCNWLYFVDLVVWRVSLWIFPLYILNPIDLWISILLFYFFILFFIFRISILLWLVIWCFFFFCFFFLHNLYFSQIFYSIDIMSYICFFVFNFFIIYLWYLDPIPMSWTCTIGCVSITTWILRWIRCAF